MPLLIKFKNKLVLTRVMLIDIGLYKLYLKYKKKVSLLRVCKGLRIEFVTKVIWLLNLEKT
jgi:hypothetical protein